MTPSAARIARRAGVVLVAALAGWGLHRATSRRPPPTLVPAEGERVVTVQEARREDFRDELALSGTLRAVADNVLRFGVDGVVREIRYKDGERVRAGDVIARLDQDEAKIKWERSELELEDKQKLYAGGHITRSKLREAELAERLARVELKKTEIQAVRNGVLGGVNAVPGDHVDPSKTIAHLADISTMTLRIAVPDKQLERIALGQQVTFTVGSLPNATFHGTIDRISPYIDPESNMGTVFSDVPNEGYLLLPNMFTRVKVSVHEAPNAVVIPLDAVLRGPAGDRVFVVDKASRAEARDVEIMYRSAEFAEIGRGVEAGERIIDRPSPDLRPGDRLRVVDSKEPQ